MEMLVNRSGLRLWTLLTCIGLAVLSGAAQAQVQAPGSFNLGHQFPADSIPDRAARKFSELVGEKSRGTLRVQVHPAATFGDERAHLALLSKQSLDFAVTGDLVVGSLSDRYLVINLPFLYRDADHALRVYGGTLGEAMRAELKTRGLVALSWHHVGVRMLTANKPIHTLKDLAGINLRLPQDTTWTAAWRALGAVPRQVPFTDLPNALKLGQVDAQENPPNFIRTSKLYAHQKYLMTTNHMPQRQFVFASAQALGRLTTAQLRMVQDAATEASRYAVGVADMEQARDIAWLTREGGMALVNFDPTGISEALKPVPQALAGAEGVEVYSQILALK